MGKPITNNPELGLLFIIYLFIYYTPPPIYEFDFEFRPPLIIRPLQVRDGVQQANACGRRVKEHNAWGKMRKESSRRMEGTFRRVERRAEKEEEKIAEAKDY